MFASLSQCVQEALGTMKPRELTRGDVELTRFANGLRLYAAACDAIAATLSVADLARLGLRVVARPAGAVEFGDFALEWTGEGLEVRVLCYRSVPAVLSYGDLRRVGLERG